MNTNTFKHQMTVLPDFHFNNFVAAITGARKKGDVSISASIGIPKDLSKRKLVRCEILVETVDIATGETDIKFTSISGFDITSAEVFQDSLLNDAESYCIPIALRETERKFEEISKILLGRPINLQLSRYIQER